MTVLQIMSKDMGLMVHPLWSTFLDLQKASVLIVFTNELSYSGGTCQLLSGWWSGLKNVVFDCSMTDPIPTYRCGLWVSILDRFRITLIMWNLRLLIESKSPTNIKTCSLENSMPIGNAQMKGKNKIPLDLWEPFLFPTPQLFFTIVSFKEYSWLRGFLHSLSLELFRWKEISKKSPGNIAS